MSERNYNAISGEDKFWLGVWSIVAAACVALIAACTYSGYHSRIVMQELVDKGAHPMVVSCSMGISQSEQGICTLLAANTKEAK